MTRARRRGSARAAPKIQIKRAYEQASPSDGYRVLVDRLWPRGIRKDELSLDAWLQDLAVSDDLRRWFGHDPARWSEFVRRYRSELRSPAAHRALEDLAERARQGPLTIVYGARDEQHNNAVVLRAVLEAMLAPAASRRRTAYSGRSPAESAVSNRARRA